MGDKFMCGNCGDTFTARLAHSIKYELREELEVGYSKSNGNAFICPDCWPKFSQAMQRLAGIAPPHIPNI